MNQLRVELLVTLKRPSDGKLLPPGACFSGTMETLPDFIRLAIEKKKDYLKVTEIAEIVETALPDVTPLDTVELNDPEPITAEIEPEPIPEKKIIRKRRIKK